MNAPTGAAWHFWFAMGSTMLHFLWIGCLLGMLAACARFAFRRAAPQVRYLVALASLAAIALAPAVLFGILVTGQLERPADPSSRGGPAGGMTNELASAVDFPLPPSGFDLNDPSIVALKSLSNDSQSTSGPHGAWFTFDRLYSQVQAPVATLCGVLPWIWFVGSPMVFTLLTTGLVGTRRLRQQSRLLVNSPVADICQRIVQALGIGQAVMVGACDRIAAPLVVGILRPMVLLPPAVLAGCDPAQLEMILWHELAHIRRHDNLVNLLQRIVESLLFFHPVVWKVSSWVRLEREHCCDAVVLRHATPRAYAETLAALAMPGMSPRFAVASMANHQLVARIRHILNLEDRSMKISQKLGLGVGVFLVAGTLFAAAWAQSAGAQPETRRPAAVLRMPKFNMSSAEATALAHYFAAADDAQDPFDADSAGETSKSPPRKSSPTDPAGGAEGSGAPDGLDGLIAQITQGLNPRQFPYPLQEVSGSVQFRASGEDPVLTQLEQLVRIYRDTQGAVPAELEKLVAERKTQLAAAKEKQEPVRQTAVGFSYRKEICASCHADAHDHQGAKLTEKQAELQANQAARAFHDYIKTIHSTTDGDKRTADERDQLVARQQQALAEKERADAEAVRAADEQAEAAERVAQLQAVAAEQRAQSAPPAAQIEQVRFRSLDVVSLANSYIQAVGDVKTAKLNYEKSQKLVEKNLASPDDLGLAQIALETAQQKYDVLKRLVDAAFEAAVAERDSVREELNRTTELYHTGAITQQAAIHAQRELVQAEAQLKILESIRQPAK